MDCIVRALRPDDVERIAAIDRKITGRSRSEWYRGRIAKEGVQLSLCAEVDGIVVGAMLAAVQYGEFGVPEPMAILDTVVVDPGLSGKGVGTALLEQLLRNLRALRVDRIRTEVNWDERDLMAFLQRSGFAPAPRMVLELDCGA